MKIQIFQSAQGDCLLLTGEDGTNMLVDGGMSDTYRKHVAPTLGAMEQNDEVLDLVCVSHIDQDHILGILTMLDDAVAWKVFDYQTSRGRQWRRPRSPRPPQVKAIWHNAFTDQVSRNRGDIEDLLVLHMQGTFFSGNIDFADDLLDLVNSERQALRLADRIDENQLNVPLNPEFDGGLMYTFSPHAPLRVGGLNCHLVGPYLEELEDLRNDWNVWVRKNHEAIDNIRRKAREDSRRLGLTELESLINDLRLKTGLGERAKVSVPNLASLMFLVEENGKRVLLTGDGHKDTILEGLNDAGLLEQDGTIHVDVLKIAHHGSEHNTDLEFYQLITADHYIFCGDGAHHNPDSRIVDALLDSRIGPQNKRSRNADGRFKLWFNNSQQVATGNDRKRHMRDLERQVAERTNGIARAQYKFLTSGSRLTVNL